MSHDPSSDIARESHVVRHTRDHRMSIKGSRRLRGTCMSQEVPQCPPAPRARRVRTQAEMMDLVDGLDNQMRGEGRESFGSLPFPRLDALPLSPKFQEENSQTESDGSKDSSSGEPEDIFTGSFALPYPRRGVYDQLLDVLEPEFMPSSPEVMLPKRTAARLIVESLSPLNWESSLNEY